MAGAAMPAAVGMLGNGMVGIAMPTAVGMLGSGMFGIAMPGAIGGPGGPATPCGAGPRGGGGTALPGGGGGTAFEALPRTGGGPYGSGGGSDESGMVGDYMYIFFFFLCVWFRSSFRCASLLLDRAPVCVTWCY